MTVLEEFQMCDEALGKWVLRGVFSRADTAKRRAGEYLFQEQVRGWGERRLPGDAELHKRADAEFARNWRVRTIEPGVVLSGDE